MAFDSGKSESSEVDATDRGATNGPPSDPESSERRARKARLIAITSLGACAAALLIVIWRSMSPPSVADVDHTQVTATIPRAEVPDALTRAEVATPETQIKRDRFHELRRRRSQPEWKVVAGIARSPTSILGVRCDFEAFNADGQPLELETIRGPAELFLLEVPREATSLRATPVGRYHLEAASLPLPDQDLNGVEILLAEATGMITGRVVDPDGVAVEDVRMNLGSSRARRMTDLAGQFTFKPLRDESYSVQVAGAPLSGIGRPAQTVSLEGGVQLTPLIFVVERGATLTGRAVASHDQSPIPGVSVTLARTGGNAHRSIVTDRDGEFVFERLAAGEYHLTATQSDGEYGRVLMPIPAITGEGLRDITVEMSASAGSVLGQIVDPSSGPLPFAQLVATRSGDRGEVLEQLRTSSDSAGRFQFPGIATGTWSIAPEDGWCKSRNWVADSATPVEVLDGLRREIELRVRAGAYLKGSVKSSSGKKGLQIRIHTPEGRIVTRGVSARGRFLVAGLRPGTYAIEAIDPAQPEEVLHRTQVYVSVEEPGRAQLIVP